MKELPGDVFVTGQIDLMSLTALVEQGTMSFINNRPNNEAFMQPDSESLSQAAAELGVDYRHIPMAGGISPEMLKETIKAYETLPRPIVAFCASGTRSAALWCFAHVKSLGVDGVLEAVSTSGYNLGQLREPLNEFLKNSDT